MATQPDQVNSGALATMFALTALATIAAALGITALVRTEQGELSRERDEPISRAYRSLRAEQELALTAPPAWVDRGEGLVSIPIGKAMELTIADVRRGRTVVGARKPDETDPMEAVTPEGGADTSDEGAQEVEGTAPGQEGLGHTPGATPREPVPSGPLAPRQNPGAPGEKGQDSRTPAAPQDSPPQGTAPRQQAPASPGSSSGAPAQGSQPSQQPSEGSGR